MFNDWMTGLGASELPKSWWADRIDGERWVLFGTSIGLLHVIAPPGTGFRFSEVGKECLMWRYAVWISEEDDPAAASVDAPLKVVSMETKEVVELLPDAHHDFVRSAMAKQIFRAVTFGSACPGRCHDDLRARQSGRTLLWLADQLRTAFPFETWFKFKVGASEIPDTAAELLRRIPVGASCEGIEIVSSRTAAATGEAPSAQLSSCRSILRGGY